MRINLLMLSMLDRVLYALNVKTVQRLMSDDDERRTALLGDDLSIQEQALRTKEFSTEIADRL